MLSGIFIRHLPHFLPQDALPPYRSVRPSNEYMLSWRIQPLQAEANRKLAQKTRYRCPGADSKPEDRHRAGKAMIASWAGSVLGS